MTYADATTGGLLLQMRESRRARTLRHGTYFWGGWHGATAAESPDLFVDHDVVSQWKRLLEVLSLEVAYAYEDLTSRNILVGMQSIAEPELISPKSIDRLKRLRALRFGPEDPDTLIDAF